MLTVDAETTIRQIIISVSSGDYLSAIAHADTSRCSVADISRVVSDYGQTFSAPPFAAWDVVAVNVEAGREAWSVRAPLWSENEGGRSDLELRFTVTTDSVAATVELDDILVA